MARSKSPKNMTPAEIREAKANLKTVLKDTVASRKEAERAARDSLNVFEATRREAAKVIATAQKQADSQLKAATKAYEAAQKRHGKVIAAAETGIAKIEGQLAALDVTAE